MSTISRERSCVSPSCHDPAPSVWLELQEPGLSLASAACVSSLALGSDCCRTPARRRKAAKGPVPARERPSTQAHKMNNHRQCNRPRSRPPLISTTRPPREPTIAFPATSSPLTEATSGTKGRSANLHRARQESQRRSEELLARQEAQRASPRLRGRKSTIHISADHAKLAYDGPKLHKHLGNLAARLNALCRARIVPCCVKKRRKLAS